MAVANTNLLTSPARIQVPWIKVTIGSYTFGVFSRSAMNKKDDDGFYKDYDYKVQYPNYIDSLNIVKINGQVNQYTLKIVYPVTQFDDPNFFEKVFSSVSGTREIIFSYGDASMPNYIYKDEYAIITKVTQQFDFASSKISYTVSAVSGSALQLPSNITWISDGRAVQPSSVIKQLFEDENNYHIQEVFTGMSGRNIYEFVDGTDMPVKLESKQNISFMEFLKYLVSCMVFSGSATGTTTNDVYILTIHDSIDYDELYGNENYNGPFFKVKRTSKNVEQPDAYELNIGGFNSPAIVSSFSVDNDENYSLYYQYQEDMFKGKSDYVERINPDGTWDSVYSPNITSKNSTGETRADDVTWWTKITQYPINATVQVQGLLRPATLMSYLRLNVIFPGGRKHISSGLYIITKQTDNISASGYKTTLGLTKISGDDSIKGLIGTELPEALAPSPVKW